MVILFAGRGPATPLVLTEVKEELHKYRTANISNEPTAG